MCLITLVTALIVPEEEAEDPRERIQLGPLCIAASLREKGHQISLINLNSISPDFQTDSILLDQEAFIESAAQEIEREGNNYIGFGSICSSYRLTIRLIKRVRELLPQSFIFLGGPQATATASETLNVAPYINAIVRGEADESVCELIEVCENNLNLSNVPGLTWLKNDDGEIVKNPDSPTLLDMDSLPIPSYDLYPESSYKGGISIDAGRGCPFACTFCSTNEFFRRRFRMKSPERLVKELNYLNKKYGAHQFSLTHDLFTTNPKTVRAICKAFKEKISFDKFEWTASARIDSMKNGLAKEMADAGCKNLFFGVETGSKRLQKVIKKNLSVNKVLPVFEEASELGIECTSSIIIGYPEENYEDVKDSVQLAIRVAKIQNVKVQMHLLVPLPKTPLSITHYNELVYSDLSSNIATTGGSEVTDHERKFLINNKDIFTQHFYIPNKKFARTELYHVAQVTFFGTSFFKYTCISLDKLKGKFINVAFSWAKWLKKNYNLEEYLFEAFYRSDDFFKLFERFSIEYCKEAEPDFVETLKDILAFEDHIQQHIRGEFIRSNAADEILAVDFNLNVPMLLGQNVSIKRFSIDIENTIQALKKDKTLAKPLQKKKAYLFTEQESGRIGFTQVSESLTEILVCCDGKHTLKEAMKIAKTKPNDKGVILTKLALMMSDLLLVPAVEIGENYMAS